MDRLLHNHAFMEKLRRLGPENHERYRTAEPYPHIVIDDFFPEEVLSDVLSEFPTPQQANWQQFNNFNEVKLAKREAEELPTTIREFLYFLNSRPVLGFLEQLTGIPALIPDMYYEGGGIHQIVPGGKLGVHIDFNKLGRFELDRRLNLLVYLNKDWKEEYGGHFELWDKEKKGCVRQVLPIFNRLVVFSTTEFSYHGHPHPLTCPPDRTRKSTAIYYYTNGRPEHEQSVGHSTVFVDDRGEGKKIGLKSTLKYLTPPVLVDLAKSTKRLFGKKA